MARQIQDRCILYDDMARKLTPLQQAAKKRPILITRTAQALGVDETRAAELLSMGRRQSFRLNTLKGAGQVELDELRAAGWDGERYDWIEEGYSIASESGQRAVRDSAPFADGRVYIQNAASWLPVVLLDTQPGQSVLDVCAAPGGKTSHVAARTSNGVRITANDNSRARLAKLQANCRRLGAEVADYTLFDGRQLANRLEDRGGYDRILLDAPCSGEGMMRLDNDKDFETWSVAQIKRLQQLQRKLLVQSWRLLKPGGTLVYSTCTMAPEENEQVIDYALRRLEDIELQPIAMKLDNRVAAVCQWNGKQMDDRLAGVLRLMPSRDIEAFFVCVLRKAG